MSLAQVAKGQRRSLSYLWLDALTQKERGRQDSQREHSGGYGRQRGGQERCRGAGWVQVRTVLSWLSILRSLVAQGLSGVELVTSDAHRGLRDAIAPVFGGASRQGCRTHSNFLTKVLKNAQHLVKPWRANYQQSSPQDRRTHPAR